MQYIPKVLTSQQQLINIGKKGNFEDWRKFVMKRGQMIAMKIYKPESTAGKEALARCVSEIHSEFVSRRIAQLTCTNQQKLRLMDSVIKEARQKDETINKR